MAGARGSRTHHTSRRTAANGFEVQVPVPKSDEKFVNIFLSDRRYRGLSDSTIQYYKGYLTRFLKQIEFPALSATRSQLTNYISQMNCSQGGKHACFRALRAFYRWLEENEYIVKSPTTKMTAPKVPKPVRATISVDDIPTLLKECITPLDRMLVTLLADTGLRRKELASIKPENINHESRTIIVWGKGSRQRRVTYGEITAENLAIYLSSIKVTEGVEIIPNVWTITNSLTRLEKATGIKCNAHTFRRTFATESIRNGMNVVHVQSLLGHSSLTMTRIYAEQVDSEDAIKAYTPIVR